MRKLNKAKGLSGEALAEFYLKNCGYTLLDRNFTIKSGEIDLIFRDGKFIVFVEVKARKSLRFGRPSEAVNAHKLNKIRLVAQVYLKIKNLMGSLCRIDVIEIVDGEINHIINAQ